MIRCWRAKWKTPRWPSGAMSGIVVSDGADIDLDLEGARELRDELTVVLDRAERGLFDEPAGPGWKWKPRTEEANE